MIYDWKNLPFGIHSEACIWRILPHTSFGKESKNVTTEDLALLFAALAYMLFYLALLLHFLSFHGVEDIISDAHKCVFSTLLKPTAMGCHQKFSLPADLNCI